MPCCETEGHQNIKGIFYHHLASTGSSVLSDGARTHT